jgi:hypothetical protein
MPAGMSDPSASTSSAALLRGSATRCQRRR